MPAGADSVPRELIKLSSVEGLRFYTQGAALTPRPEPLAGLTPEKCEELHRRFKGISAEKLRELAGQSRCPWAWLILLLGLPKQVVPSEAADVAAAHARSSEELIALFYLGCDWALEFLAIRYLAALESLFGHLKDHDPAAAAIRTFEQVRRTRDLAGNQYRGPESFPFWLYRIAMAVFNARVAERPEALREEPSRAPSQHLQRCLDMSEAKVLRAEAHPSAHDLDANALAGLDGKELNQLYARHAWTVGFLNRRYERQLEVLPDDLSIGRAELLRRARAEDLNGGRPASMLYAERYYREVLEPLPEWKILEAAKRRSGPDADEVVIVANGLRDERALGLYYSDDFYGRTGPRRHGWALALLMVRDVKRLLSWSGKWRRMLPEDALEEARQQAMVNVANTARTPGNRYCPNKRSKYTTWLGTIYANLLNHELRRRHGLVELDAPLGEDADGQARGDVIVADGENRAALPRPGGGLTWGPALRELEEWMRREMKREHEERLRLDVWGEVPQQIIGLFYSMKESAVGKGLHLNRAKLRSHLGAAYHRYLVPLAALPPDPIRGLLRIEERGKGCVVEAEPKLIPAVKVPLDRPLPEWAIPTWAAPPEFLVLVAPPAELRHVPDGKSVPPPEWIPVGGRMLTGGRLNVCLLPPKFAETDGVVPLQAITRGDYTGCQLALIKPPRSLSLKAANASLPPGATLIRDLGNGWRVVLDGPEPAMSKGEVKR